MNLTETFIFGAQGAGKSLAARRLINSFLENNPALLRRPAMHAPMVYAISENDFKSDLAQFLRQIDAPVIVFDGHILKSEDLNKATKAIRAYARHLSNVPVLAVYVIQGESSNFITYRHDK